MAKFIMVVQSRAMPGRDDEYNEWYDTTHLADICSLPSVRSGRRFEFAAAPIGQPGLPYLSMFEIEADDPGNVLAEMQARAAEGRMEQTDALDAAASVMWFYRQWEPEPGGSD